MEGSHNDSDVNETSKDYNFGEAITESKRRETKAAKPAQGTNNYDLTSDSVDRTKRNLLKLGRTATQLEGFHRTSEHIATNTNILPFQHKLPQSSPKTPTLEKLPTTAALNQAMQDSHNDTEANELTRGHLSGRATTESTRREALTPLASSNQKETTKPDEATINSDPSWKSHRDKNREGKNENQEAKKSNSGVPVPKKDDGVAVFLDGIKYQKEIAFVILCPGIKLMQDDKTSKFTITSEDKEVGKFDDMVIRFVHDHHAYNMYIQAKCKEDATKEVRLEDIKSTGKNGFSLSLYFNNFLYHNLVANERNVYVLCTNIGLAKDVEPLVEKCSLGNKLDYFLESMSDDVYKLNGEKIDEGTKTSLMDYFQQNSDLCRLAKELAYCIYKENNIDCNLPLFQNYQPAIKQIAKQTAGKSGLCNVDEEFFKRKDVVESGFKRIFEKTYRILLGEQQQDIWEHVRNRRFRFSRERKLTKSQNCALPPKVKKSQIRMFLNSFRLVCSTKHKKIDVMHSMSKQLASLGPLEYDFLHDRLSTWIMEWIREGKGARLEKNDIQSFYHLSVSSLEYLPLKCISQRYCTSLQNLSFKCKNGTLETRELYKKLNLWLSEKSSYEINTLEVQRDQYPTWFVLQILQSAQNISEKKLHILFLNQRDFEKYKEKVKYVFCWINFPLVLVIDQSDAEYTKSEIGTSNWCLQGKGHNKMIIAIKQHCLLEAVEEQLLFKDLTDDCKTKIINTNANFFGTTTCYQDIFNTCDALTFVSHVRSYLVGSLVYRDINNDRYCEIENIYIPRRWKSWDDNDTKNEHEFTGMFWRNSNILAYTREELNRKFSTAVNVPIGEFLNIFRNLDHGFKRLINLQAQGQKTAAGTESQRPQHPPGFATNNSNSDRKTCATMKVHIIFNHAGSGKSFFMIWLANYLQLMEGHKDLWVIHVNLIEHVTDFAETQLKCQNTIKIDSIRLLFQLIYLDIHVSGKFDRKMTELRKTARKLTKCLQFLQGNLELDENGLKCTSEQLVLMRIFKCKFNNKKLIVLLDGFDEIAPNYKTMVLKFLGTLRSLEAVYKMYLTSRPYDFKPEMDAALGECAYYRLDNFVKRQFCMFIHRFLSVNMEDYKNWDKQAQSNILELHTILLNMVLSNMLNIPLFFSMGIELLLPIVKKNLYRISEINALQIINDCDKQFSTLGMVETFIQKKLIVSIEKSGYSADDPSAIEMVKEKLSKIQNTHSILALYALMNKNVVEELLAEGQPEKATSYIEELKNGSEKSGIVDGVVDDTPIFVHRLFAEYFAALWFFTNVQQNSVINFLKCTVYQRMEKEEIRMFLDRMICGNKILHTAILDGSREKVQRLLIEFPHLIQETDEWGRTPLHLASLCDSKFMMGLLLACKDGLDAIDVKDKYFHWTAVDYAYNFSRINAFNNKYSTKKSLHKALKFESDLFKDLQDTGRNCRVFLKRLYTKLVEDLASEKQFDLGLSMTLHYYARLYPSQIKNTSPTDQDSVNLLELCTIIDSQMLPILLEHSKETTVSKAQSSLLIQLAVRHRSVNALQYFLLDQQFILSVVPHYETHILVLVAWMQSDEEKFRDNFHTYCVNYKIPRFEENELSPILNDVESQNFDKSILLQSELSRFKIPERFELSATLGIDMGSELLICMALHTQNRSILEYLIAKLKLTINNRLIKHLVQIHNIHWHKSTFTFLVRRSENLRSPDETGQNLLHFAVAKAELDLVKCLIEFGFKTTDINPNENNWDAFFYCVQKTTFNNKLKLNIFKYLVNVRKEPTFDGFNHKDSDGKSVLYYAAKYVQPIATQIIEEQFSMPLKCFNAGDIIKLINLLLLADLNSEEILRFCPTNWMQNKATCVAICETLDRNTKLKFSDSMGRNLFYFAIEKKLFLLVDYLINHVKLDTGLNPETILKYLPKLLKHQTENCALFCEILGAKKNPQCKYLKGRNILHIAILKKRYNLAQCLIERYGFNVADKNDKENNWNAFFYCVKRLPKNFHSIKETLSFFWYMIDKDPQFHCVDKLTSRKKSILYNAYQQDLRRKSVFYYAYNANPKITHSIVYEQFGANLNRLKLKQIVDLTNLLQSAGFNPEETFRYYESTHLSNEVSCSKICEALERNEKLSYTDSMDRNLLHIAIQNEWFALAKCLIQQFQFNVSDISKREIGWNALFYCVATENEDGNIVEKQGVKEKKHKNEDGKEDELEDDDKDGDEDENEDENEDAIEDDGEDGEKDKHEVEDIEKIREVFFSYMLSKKAIDCFDGRDFKQKNVFFYAVKNHPLIADNIISNALKATSLTSIEQQALLFHKRLKETGHEKGKVITFLKHWRQLSNLKSKSKICDKTMTLVKCNWP